MYKFEQTMRAEAYSLVTESAEGKGGCAIQEYGSQVAEAAKEEELGAQ